jgi:hypothetical protein
MNRLTPGVRASFLAVCVRIGNHLFHLPDPAGYGGDPRWKDGFRSKNAKKTEKKRIISEIELDNVEFYA